MGVHVPPPAPVITEVPVWDCACAQKWTVHVIRCGWVKKISALTSSSTQGNMWTRRAKDDGVARMFPDGGGILRGIIG